jgi:UDP-glucose 4-epimerase
MRLLLTGGTGYIGSHTALALLEAGHEVVLFDNLSNSSPDVRDILHELSGKDVPLVVGDLRNPKDIHAAFAAWDFDAVLHFAGLKAVGESVAKPDLYFENNVGGTANLLAAMEAAGVRRIVFSSSATVYGNPESNPIPETARLEPSNPYGATKLHIEEMLRAKAGEDGRWEISVLRYFNPVGAHPSGRIGEAPAGIPNNLMPYIQKVAAGALPRLHVFGGDYPTPDGTGIRDYIHVCDLADGHLAALEHLKPGCGVYNLGTGRGVSVLDLVRAFEAANGLVVPFVMDARRPGDIPACFADSGKAQRELGWKAVHTLTDMCRDAWRFAGTPRNS